MKAKPLILFGVATVAAFVMIARGQNASPSGTLAPKRNQKPASVHISPTSYFSSTL
jgi:cephalosporin-C deacetylase-like acetyl esterase